MGYFRTDRKTYINILVRKYYTTSTLTALKFLASPELKTLKFLWGEKRKANIVNISEILQNPTFLKISLMILVLKTEKLNCLVFNTTLKNIKTCWFKNLSWRLKNHRFKYISFKLKNNKTNKNNQKNFVDTKLLQISIFRNAIVSQAIELILELLYEPVFFKSSHGFRPSKDVIPL